MEMKLIDKAEFTGKEYQPHAEYWKTSLSKIDAPFILSERGVLPDKQSSERRKLIHKPDGRSRDAVASLAKGSPQNNYVVTVSALFVMLSRYVADTTAVIHVPYLRTDDAKPGASIPLVQSLRGVTIRELLQASKDLIVNAHRYEAYPVSLLDIDKQLPKPMSNVSYCYEAVHNPIEAMEFSNVRFFLSGEGKDFQLGIEYHAGNISDAFAVQVLRHWDLTLRQFDSLDRNIDKISLLNEEEMKQVQTFSAGEKQHIPFPTLVEAFEHQVERTPGNVAVVNGDVNLTFGDLNKKANRIANYLRQEYGILAGDRVGIMVERSEYMIIAILAALKSGAAYVPIDPHYPEERKNFILDNADPKILIIGSSHMVDIMHVSKPVFVIDLQIEELMTSDENLSHKPTANDLAYIIYTSGSTGKPKGVMIEHGSILNTLFWSIRYYGFNTTDKRLQIPSFSFDSSATDILGSLLSGGTLVMLDNDKRTDLFYLEALIHKHEVTNFLLVPSFYRVVLQGLGNKLSHLRKIVVAGEAVDANLVKEHFLTLPNVSLVNEYGPTENSVCSTVAELKDNKQITIGGPIDNISVYVLDDKYNLLPPGVAGEIAVSGPGIARGYWRDKELTARKFIANPFRAGEKLYLTGDLGQWTKYGTIEFLGRKDEQLKIRGFRIEPAEIENLLKEHEDVNEAVVTAFADQQQTLHLIAYVSRKQPGETSDLEAYVSGKLPEFMVPLFVAVDEFPRTPSGKIDRRNLPDPFVARQKGKEYLGPRTPVESSLQEIWKSILSLDTIGVNENFFSLGGHSLTATQLMSRIHREFNVKVDLREIFTNNSIEMLAELIGKASQENFVPITKVAEHELYEISHAQKRLWIIDKFQSGANYNIPTAYKLTGKLNIDAFINAFYKLLERHEILRTTFVEVEGVPMQRINALEEYNFTVDFDDFSLHDDRYEKIKAIANEEAVRKFDLTCGPLIRGRILQVERHEYVFLLTMHHIVTDAWSMIILFNEVIAIYNDLLGVSKLALTPLEIQYKDYAAWQNQQLQGGNLEFHREFWMDQFAGELPVLDLATDFQRTDIRASSGDAVLMSLGTPLSERVYAFCSQNEVSLFMMLVATLKTLLYRYTGQEDIIVGSPVAGRTHQALENQIGFYVNTLALRSTFSGDDSFRNLLSQVRDTTLGAYDHQIYPFDKLIEDLQLERNTQRTPLFDVNLVLQNTDVSGIEGLPNLEELHALHVDTFEFEFKTNRFDLLLNCNEYGGSVQVNFEYNDKLFRRERIAKMSEHFKCILMSILGNPDAALKDLQLMPLSERQRMLTEFAVEQYAPYSNNVPVHRLIEESVRMYSNQPAIVASDSQLSYEELNDRANQLANFILSKKLPHRATIGLLMKFATESVIAILGILKAGCSYLPVDPSYPYERIKFILKDAGIALLVCEKDLLGITNKLQWECENLQYYLCMDADDVYASDEHENQLMNQELWDYVGDNAIDTISGGGWVSSYTGEKFSPEEMEEYACNILEKTKPFVDRTSRVLEIGCASGISMLKIAPLTGYYLGTDLSQKILNFASREVSRSGITNVRLQHLAAHQIDELQEKDFDVILCNSVIQSFNGYNYLRKVIRKAIEKLNDKGTLIFGDVQDLEQKQALLTSLNEFAKNQASQEFIPKTDWSNELFVAKQFFEDLRFEFPEIEKVEHSRKIGSIDNELSMFRYDTILHINKKNAVGSRPTQRHKFQYSWNDVMASSSENPGLDIQDSDIAYTIYTSGTTGNPKGVKISHASLANYISWSSSYYFGSDEGNMPLLTSLAFDLTITSVFCPLVRGKSIFVYNEPDIKDTLQRVFSNFKIDSIKLTPSHITVLNYLPTLIYSGVKNVIVGGEKLHRSHVDILRTFNPDVNIFNEYGPTEATVGCTVAKITDDYFDIGRPIGNMRIYVLDKNRNMCPAGNFGELCIAGIGTSAGYLGNDTLTNQKFVPDPFFAGEKMYLTGDLARWSDDGWLQLLGRKDLQVKLRGFRIEMEEIEKTLMSHPAVREAIVANRFVDDQEVLIAYYTGRLMKHDVLYDFLHQYLPEFMIPTHFIRVDDFSLTLNGKLDVRSLPLPNEDSDADETFLKPTNEFEMQVHDIWREVLGSSKIGVRDNFFKIGGHSLKATQVLARIAKKMQVKIDLAYLFNHPTIEALAKKVEISNWVKSSSEFVVNDNEENIII